MFDIYTLAGGEFKWASTGPLLFPYLVGSLLFYIRGGGPLLFS